MPNASLHKNYQRIKTEFIMLSYTQTLDVSS